MNSVDICEQAGYVNLEDQMFTCAVCNEQFLEKDMDYIFVKLYNVGTTAVQEVKYICKDSLACQLSALIRGRS